MSRRRALPVAKGSGRALGRSPAGNPTLEGAVSLLKEACRTKQPAPKLVLGALRFLEDARPPVDPAAARKALDGEWKLVFSTVVPVEQLQYIPVGEQRKAGF